MYSFAMSLRDELRQTYLPVLAGSLRGAYDQRQSVLCETIIHTPVEYACLPLVGKESRVHLFDAQLAPGATVLEHHSTTYHRDCRHIRFLRRDRRMNWCSTLDFSRPLPLRMNLPQSTSLQASSTDRRQR